MADTERHLQPNEFHSRLTSPKHAEQVGTEMHNGGILAFKVYPKAWEDDHHSSTERFDIPSPQIDDDDIEDDMSKRDRLQRSMNLPPMSPTMSSPPPKYVASQVCVCVCVCLCVRVCVCAELKQSIKSIQSRIPYVCIYKHSNLSKLMLIFHVILIRLLYYHYHVIQEIAS